MYSEKRGNQILSVPNFLLDLLWAASSSFSQRKTPCILPRTERRAASDASCDASGGIKDIVYSGCDQLQQRSPS